MDVRGIAWALAAACTTGDEPAPEPVEIAVFMPLGVAVDGELPGFAWAADVVNATGGVAGRPLALRWVDPDADPDARAAQAQALAVDGDVVAVIGPPGSAALMDVAPTFSEQNKPLLSTTSTSDEVLRAWGGTDAVWRLRGSDIPQTELLVRRAWEGGARRASMLASTDVGGLSFFSWFGFFAREQGFAAGDARAVALPSGDCRAAVEEALASRPEVLFVAANTPEELRCVAQSLPPAGQPRPQVVFADTGLDPGDLARVGAEGVTGLTGGGDPAFTDGFLARFPDAQLAPHGRSEYDAVLLLAYALEVSEGKGGAALRRALVEVVEGDGPSAGGWDEAGVAAALAALRAGDRPALAGATGALRFLPDLRTDLAAAAYDTYTILDGALVRDGSVTAETATAADALPAPSSAPTVEETSGHDAPPREDLWAFVGVTSSGWSNYRHQSDALQQYARLRANGLPDDHIALIAADDLASAAVNPLPGVVRNTPGGPDVYDAPAVDQGLDAGASGLYDALTGAGPAALGVGPGSDLLVYLVGHGGTSGLPIGAGDVAAGLADEVDAWSPASLRQALCALRSEGRLRRALIVIESCYSGAFGEAEYGGLAAGCDDVAPGADLDGVVLLTAASSAEVSFAGGYDPELGVWVNDTFSRAFFEAGEASPDASIAALYLEAYQRTIGSHPTVYDARGAGRLADFGLAEFVRP